MKTTFAAARCHFVSCRNPVTHTVQRLWTIPGRAPLPVQQCCDVHVPGSRARNSADVAAAARNYRVTRIADGA